MFWLRNKKIIILLELIVSPIRANILTRICLFIVITNRMIKYMTKIGQNTGILNASKNVHIIAMTTALVPEYLKKKRNIINHRSQHI